MTAAAPLDLGPAAPDYAPHDEDASREALRERAQLGAPVRGDLGRAGLAAHYEALRVREREEQAARCVAACLGAAAASAQLRRERPELFRESAPRRAIAIVAGLAGADVARVCDGWAAAVAATKEP